MSVEERWRGRPYLALGLKTLIVAVPLAISVVVSVWAARRLPTPHGVAPTVLWWLTLMAISLVVVAAGELVARRFLPLVALLRLSLLFPGKAPSRIGVARASTRAELRRITELVDREGLGTDLATVARTLVILVGALDAHDRATRGHSERVRIYTDMIADDLDLDEPDRDRLRWAALLHDLGKLRVPLSVLNKRSPLTDADWELIHRHPVDGDRMLGPLRDWLGEWASVVRHHHERWDGEGYPDRIAGEDISLGARIVAVADSYDVMTSIRSYQPRARSAGAAREELVANAGTQFDPSLVRRFLGLSTRRLWLVLGPISWIAQLPAVGPVIAQSSIATSTGQAVVVLGAASVAEGGVRDLPLARERRRADSSTTTTEPPSATLDVEPTTPSDPPGVVTTLVPPAGTTSSLPVSTVLGETTTTAGSAPSTSAAAAGSTSTSATSTSTTASSTTASTTTSAVTSTSTPTTATASTNATTTTTVGSTTPGTALALRTCDTAAQPATAPDLADDTARADGDAVVIDVLANDTDPDGDLDDDSIALGEPPDDGDVRLLDGALVYTPRQGAIGTDRFVYTLLDDAGACDAATVRVINGGS